MRRMVINKCASKHLSTFLSCVLTGCAADSGVVALGNDSFMISKQAVTGFPGTGKIKSEALNEAAAECQRRGKAAKVMEILENEPPYILGNYPNVQVTFDCVEEKMQ